MSVSDDGTRERAGEENKNEEREREGERGREIELPAAAADSRNERTSILLLLRLPRLLPRSRRHFVRFPSPFLLQSMVHMLPSFGTVGCVNAVEWFLNKNQQSEIGKSVFVP